MESLDAKQHTGGKCRFHRTIIINPSPPSSTSRCRPPSQPPLPSPSPPRLRHRPYLLAPLPTPTPTSSATSPSPHPPVHVAVAHALPHRRRRRRRIYGFQLPPGDQVSLTAAALCSSLPDANENRRMELDAGLVSSDRPGLPPPGEMKSKEGFALRKWRR